MNDAPDYDRDEMLGDLATGMDYDDFAELYGWRDPVVVDTVMADLQHQGYDVERDVEANEWTLRDAEEVLDG